MEELKILEQNNIVSHELEREMERIETIEYGIKELIQGVLIGIIIGFLLGFLILK